MVDYNFSHIQNQIVTFFPTTDTLRFSFVSASEVVATTTSDNRLRLTVGVESTVLVDTTATVTPPATSAATTLAMFDERNLSFNDGSVFLVGDRTSATTTLDGGDNIFDFVTDPTLTAALHRNNQIHGLGGADTVILSNSTGNHVIYGGLGADTILAGNGHHTIFGGSGIADSADGADSIVAGSGNQIIYGNGGSDTVTFSAATGLGRTVQFWGGVGADQLTSNSSAGSYYVDGGTDSDSISITNSSGNNTVLGGAGADVINLSGSTGAAYIYGGSGIADSTDGNDTITSGSGYTELYANAGNDVVALHTASGHSATVYLGLGNDTLTSGVVGGTYRIWAGTGNDVIDLTGHQGEATIFGGNDVGDPTDGNDTITAGSGSYVIYGNGGNDRINLTPAAGRSAVVYAGAGNDTISVNALHHSAAVTLFGNTGDDRFYLNFATATPTVRIEDYGTGTNGLEVTLSGGTGAASLTVDRNGTTDTVLRHGAAEAIFLGGFRGNFTSQLTKFSDGSFLITNFGGNAASLAGGVGGDQLIAGNNGDTLSAGAGNDLLIGGTGNDRFVFLTANFTMQDTVQGGNGTDQLVLGTPGTAINDTAFTHVSSVEQLVLQSGDYSPQIISLANAATSAGIRLIDASAASGARFDVSGMAQGITYRGATTGDYFVGTSLVDVIEGRAGNDTLFGGGGNDTIIGGEGNDVFAYTSGLEGRDTYTDVNFGTASTSVDRFQFNASAGGMNLGNNDTQIDGAIITSVVSAGAAGTELIILRNFALNAETRTPALDIINSDATINSGVVNIFYDSSDGHVVIYYDTNGRLAGGHVQLASLENLKSLTDMNAIDFSDFLFTI